MTAKELKPYLFWIICGVILLAEIAIMFLVSPSVENGPATVPDAKSDLDREVAIERPARSHRPASLRLAWALANIRSRLAPARSAEDQVQMDRLLGTYLVVDKWTDDLQGRLDEYSRQEEVLKDLYAQTMGDSVDAKAIAAVGCMPSIWTLGPWCVVTTRLTDTSSKRLWLPRSFSCRLSVMAILSIWSRGCAFIGSNY